MIKKLIFLVFLLDGMFLWAQNRALVNTGAAKEKRLALVIGNGDYPAPNGLGEQPKNDAKDMAAALKELGFEVDDVLINGNKFQIDKAVRLFSANLTRYDVGLIFYAGHGIAIDGINYIIPIDFPEYATKADMPYVATDIDWIQGKMRDAGAENKTNIIIVDACRDAGNVLRSFGIGGTGRSYNDEGPNWVPPKNLPTGVITCFAASNGQKADNNAGQRNGLYTGTLLKHIKTPNLLITQVFSRVRADLLKLKGQEPEEHNKLTKDFYFNPKTITPSPVPQPTDNKTDPLANAVSDLQKAQVAFEAKNYVEAARLYDKYKDVYRLNNAEMNNIGRMYDEGWGYSVNDTEAVKWYRKAADNGSAAGMYNLALMYKGGEGVGQDMVQYESWIRKAAAFDHDKAKEVLKEMEAEKNKKVPVQATNTNSTVRYANLTGAVRKAAIELEDNLSRIPGGTFRMGCTSEQGYDCSNDEKIIHMVTLGKFAMSKYEVTQEQWRAIMGSDPPNLYNKGCDRCPVESVSWEDIQGFIRKLNGLTGMNYRLPTEAEWEYAARGGQSFKYAGSNNIEEVAWYDGNYKSRNHGSRGTTKPVGLKKANGYGLYDMAGNVWEWCSDWYGDYSASGQTNPLGVSKGSARVNRGGSWLNFARNCRVSDRSVNSPGLGYSFIGFRLANDN